MFDGIAGTMNARVKKTATMEGIPKTIAVFIFTTPLFLQNQFSCLGRKMTRKKEIETFIFLFINI